MPDADVVPTMECDLVMKGGITSGVVYPGALVEFSRSYRFRGMGGASAGAIGAAFGAAAEHGRAAGGFAKLSKLPQELGDGALGKLFQPQDGTRPLMRLLNAWLDSRSIIATLRTATATFPVAALLGALSGLACIVVGVASGGFAGWVLAVVGLGLLLLGWLAGLGVGVWRVVTRALPQNFFGICRGVGTAEQPGFTDWLATRIDLCAGLAPGSPPLTFGDLWGSEREDEERQIDLRMVTTCLTMGRPFELPMESRTFFYDPAVWRTLFPAYVVEALEAATPAPPASGPITLDSDWEDSVAAHHEPPLRRLPEARLLPVVVATRLSLSFPVLISAMPMWTIDRRDPANREAVEAFRKAKKDKTTPPSSGLPFVPVWFSDGGLCSNFPVHLFDAPLSTRPTFAINLGPFPEDQVPDSDQSLNIDYARSNSEGLTPTHATLPMNGLGALTTFAKLAGRTARDWQDSSHIAFPGYRDRIVQVFQTGDEGGLNLNMDTTTIGVLSERGSAAARALVEQYAGAHYKPPSATGWDNHRWARYRALMSVLPAWLAAYADGKAALAIDPARPPSYEMTVRGRQLAADLEELLDRAAALVSDADGHAVEDLTGQPRPQGLLRRVPVT